MARGSAARRQAIRRKETQSGPPGMPRWRSSTSILERLIDAEVCDLEAQRVDSDELVRHVLAHDEIDLRDVGFAVPLGAGTGCVVDLLKGHGSLEWRRAQLGQADVLNRYLDLVCGGIGDEHL